MSQQQSKFKIFEKEGGKDEEFVRTDETNLRSPNNDKKISYFKQDDQQMDQLSNNNEDGDQQTSIKKIMPGKNRQYDITINDDIQMSENPQKKEIGQIRTLYFGIQQKEQNEINGDNESYGNGLEVEEILEKIRQVTQQSFFKGMQQWDQTNQADESLQEIMNLQQQIIEVEKTKMDQLDEQDLKAGILTEQFLQESHYYREFLADIDLDAMHNQLLDEVSSQNFESILSKIKDLETDTKKLEEKASLTEQLMVHLQVDEYKELWRASSLNLVKMQK